MPSTESKFLSWHPWSSKWNKQFNNLLSYMFASLNLSQFLRTFEVLVFPADIRHSNSKGVPSVITRPGRDTNDWAGDTLDTPHHKSSLLNQYRHHSPHWKLYSAINLSLSKGLGGGKRALCSSAGVWLSGTKCWYVYCNNLLFTVKWSSLHSTKPRQC